MKKIKIVYLINSLPQAGPVQILKGIIAHLNPSVFDIVIIKLLNNSSDISSQFLSMGWDVISMNFSKLDLELRTKKVAKILDGFLNNIKPNIIHTHGYHPVLIASKLKYDCPKIETLHNICSEDFISSKGFLLGSWMKKRYLKNLGNLSGSVAISRTVMDYYKKYADIRQIDLIYNGISVVDIIESKERLRKKLSLPSSQTIFICVGNLSKIKDPLTVIRAFKKLKEKLDYRPVLLFLGQGNLLNKCRIESKDDCDIIFAGWKPNPIDYIRAADFMICASHSEGFGLNLFESLSVGTPVIASDIPTFKEFAILFPELKRFMFSTGSDCSLCDSMSRILENVPDYKKIMTEIRTNFSYKVMSDNYSKLYLDYLEA